MSAPVLVEALSVASLAAVSYVSTNLYNLVLLSAYGAKPGTRPLFVKLTFVFVCFEPSRRSSGAAGEDGRY